ncbi:Tyrosine-protein kinase CSK [Leucoagaricus sp. SymC.cos]|nr:Tyrosine-protein kinase CSK [Leucoagaricus sp. SymC.cos]
MASQAPAENPPNDTDTFAPLRQLVLRIDSENYAQEVTDKARDLSAEERQLLVDVLSTAICRTRTLSQRHALAWKSLIKIALSAHIFARNRTIKSEYTTSDIGASVSIKVLRQSTSNTAIFHEKLVEWVHLSHPNILPLYAAFLEMEEHPCLVSPHISNIKICERAWELGSDWRLPLILDVVDGLCYLHQLNIVHGGLCPDTVMISDDRRALITNLNATSKEQDSNLPIQYSPPEVLLGDDTQAMKAMDTWFFACLSHEVLLGRVPFCQFPNDFKATAAIGKGHKPAQPSCEGQSGDKISDMIWNILLLCWEYEAADCLTCLKVLEMLSHMRIEDYHSEPRPMVPFEALKTSKINPKPAKNILIKVLGSYQPSSSQALDTTRVAARTLSCDDTQTLVDFLKLVIHDLPYLPESNLTGQLLESIMDSLHIVPQYYRVDGVQYDSTLLVSEVSWGKIYARHGSKFHVCDTESGIRISTVCCLALWANALHPNLLPFNGGTLEEYMLALPQKSRLPLISDVANGLAYLQNTLGVQEILTGVHLQDIVVSDEGRALLTAFGLNYTLFWKLTGSSLGEYTGCFTPPSKGNPKEGKRVIWSLGCVYYLVLSRKLPYHQFSDEQVYPSKNGGELLMQPNCTDAEMDEIDNGAWDMIMKCCAPDPDDRPNCSQIQAMLANMEIEDQRPPATPLSLPEIQVLRARPEFNLYQAETIAEVLRGPLSELIENHTKDIAMAIVDLERDDVQTVVNFLDQALKERLTIAEERNRVLAVLSRITSTTLIFPQRFELTGLKQGPRKFIDKGGCGTVYQGADPTISNVVNGLHYLHGLGIVHGDLKGENVLISDDGHGLITDFGTSHINMATAATGSLSSTMLHFSAPEMVLGNRKPTKEFDIWSLGCLFYAILSRKAPYYQYQMKVQIIAALTRKEVPKRPSSADDDDGEEKDDYDWDDDIKQDYDAIDDQAWSLIVKCCVPEPENRLNISSVQELVIDMKIHNNQPGSKAIPGTEILKLRVEPKINLTHVEELLDQVQAKVKARIAADSTDA